MASVTVKNIDSLKLKLKLISDMDLKKTMGKALTMVHGEAKTLAPVDTGELSESIHMEQKKTQEGREGRVFTNLEYAMYVEFGTGQKGNGSYPYDIDGLKLAYKEDWVGMVAQPYMYPALKNNEKAIKKLFKEDTKDKLISVCKGGQ